MTFLFKPGSETEFDSGRILSERGGIRDQMRIKWFDPRTQD